MRVDFYVKELLGSAPGNPMPITLPYLFSCLSEGCGSDAYPNV